LATLDPSRTAIELTEEELGVATMLFATPDHPALEDPERRETVGALERAGIAADGRVGGYPSALLAVVAEPKLTLIVERFVTERTVLERAWSTELHAVWAAAAGDGAIELTPVEPTLLPWAIARAVGLGPRASAPLDTRISLPSSALDQAYEELAVGHREAAESVLEQRAELDAPERRAFLDLLRDRRSSWRASSRWRDEEHGEQVSEVAVIDGGRSGLWLREYDEDAIDPTVRLTPIPPSVAWKRIVALMPAPARAGEGAGTDS